MLKWLGQYTMAIVHVLGLLIFYRGFFPQKQSLSGEATFFQSPQPVFSKVVVMVVDAMRSDMFYGHDSQMSTLHTLINSGVALPYTAYSNPPTVTLPRLKGITSGSTPSFLDAIMNINEDDDTALNSDSWVGQFVSSGKKIHFYGDDTWIKLFPNEFDVFEGTNSFYVSDFTEVDNNVTRHLDRELNGGWDGLILHYLGLDHIGHKGGPHSPYMPAKQREMDGIISRLYDYVESHHDTLLVVLGDHGMNEIGNHGGASEGEVSPGLVFISPKLKPLGLGNEKAPVEKTGFDYYNSCKQVDIVPTISSLLGLPIPKNSVGVVLEQLLPLFKNPVQILRENALQLATLSGENVEPIHQWDSVQLYSFLRKIQDDLSLAATDYNYDDIWLGLGLLALATVMGVVMYLHYYTSGTKSVKASWLGYLFFFGTVVYSTHFHGSSLIEEEHHIWWFLTTVTTLALTMYNKWLLVLLAGLRVIRAWANSGQKHWSDDKMAVFLDSHPDILWMLVVATYIGVAILMYSQGNLVSSLNYLGGTASAQDLKQIGTLLGFVFSFITMSMSLAFKLVQYWADGHLVPSWIRWLLYWVLSNYEVDVSSPDDKIAIGAVQVHISNVAIYFMVVFLLAVLISGKFKGIRGGYFSVISAFFTLYLMHHTRVELIPMFIAFEVVKYAFIKLISPVVKDIDYRVLSTTVFTLMVANLSFFSMGFTNSLATVDLANAYNGVQSYNLLLVGWLTFVSNFSGPLYWSVSALQMLFEPSRIAWGPPSPADVVLIPQIKNQVFLVKQQVTFMFYSVAAVSLVASCIHLRFHLFIWSVFSPKLLFFGVWAVFVNLAIDLVVGSAIVLIG